MTVLVRFAPSPTGYIHIGNVRTALVNFLFARKQGGKFLLRLDDTDTVRSKDEYTQALKEDLNWLGLVWNDYKKQSDRFAEYEQARQKLMAAGRLYPCYETAEELDMRRKMQAGRGLPPIYDRAALQLTNAQKTKYEAEGRKPHYRFLLNDKPIVWNDMIRGEVKFQGTHVSDPVLIREDGVPLYTLASVVDDGDMGVTHIIRGEDHVSNTAVQVQIFEALGYKVPEFGHLALLKTKEGELSKRIGGNDIRGLRSAGIEPMAVNSLLAKLGTSDSVEPFATMEELVASFDIKKFGRATANYDVHELERLNEKLLHKLPFFVVKDRLPFADEPFWLSVRANIKILAEVRQWWDVIHGDIGKPEWDIISNGNSRFAIEAIQKDGAIFEDIVEFDKEYLSTALTLLPTGNWNENTWSEWTQAIKTSTGRKGKELFQPLRFAITAQKHGPEMKVLLPLIGYEKVNKRLKNCIL